MVTQDEREFFANTQTVPRPSANGYKPSGGFVTEWPAPLARDAYNGLAGEIVEAISEVVEADPVATLANLLTAFGSAVGPDAHMPVSHDRHPARFYMALVGDSSKGRKGSSWSEPRTLFEQIDQSTDLKWTNRVRQGGLSSGEGVIYQVRDPRWEKQPIKEKSRVVDYQDVLVDEGEPDKRLFVIEEEFAELLSVMKRDGNNVSAILRQSWDHGNLSPMTKNQRMSATGAHISIVGHITRDELLARLDSTTMVNGFANRFLWLAVRRAKLLPWGGGLHEDAIRHFASELHNAIAFARHIGRIAFDPEARDLWESVYTKLSGAKPGMLGAVVARGEAHVLRLSLCYALLDRSDVVRPEHLMAAVAFWDYAEASACWIFGDSTGDPMTDAIVGALKQVGEQGIDATGLHSLFSRNQSGGRIKQVIDRLISSGLIGVRSEETGGRPRNVFFWLGT